MQTWIALFRGINVGGNHILPMAELRADLEALGMENVRTYIQSGNAVFDSKARSAAALGQKIEQRIETEHGFRPQVFVLTREDLLSAIGANPFLQATEDPSKLHFGFLAEPATDADLTALEAAAKASEAYVLGTSVFYLHAPEGIGRSKLAANLEKHLGVAVTARNYRTVDKLLAIAEDR